MFPGKGWVVTVYYAMLISHVILAIAVVPMIGVAALRAVKAWRGGEGLNTMGDFSAHRTIARWTLMVWFYVTVTGVLIYVTLYHIYRP